MLIIALWTLLYSIVVAASILLIGKPSTVLGQLSFKTLMLLLLDWRFLLGGILALAARFIFVIINNLASKNVAYKDSHLSIAALATIVSIIFVLFANYLILGEQLRPIQLIGASIIMVGVFLVFK